MKRKLADFKQNYRTALWMYLKRGSTAGLQKALGLGNRAGALGLGTIELAGIHAKAFAGFGGSGTKKTLDKRANIFFAEANIPIQKDFCGQNEKWTNLSLDESLLLQKNLRQLTHQVLKAQEEDRRKISCELQDEIAQALLGINVRLLSLGKQGQGKTHGLKKQIASTQQVVLESVKSVLKFAHQLDIQQLDKGEMGRLLRTNGR